MGGHALPDQLRPVLEQAPQRVGTRRAERPQHSLETLTHLLGTPRVAPERFPWHGHSQPDARQASLPGKPTPPGKPRLQTGHASRQLWPHRWQSVAATTDDRGPPMHLLNHHLDHHASDAPDAVATATLPAAPGRLQGRRRSLAFGVLLLCCFAVVVDLTVTNLALPVIAADFRVGTGALQWVVDAYNLTLAGLLLLGGGLADRFGRKRIFLLGFALFGLGCLVAALAPSIGALVAARSLMGVGAAFVLTPSMAIIADLFPPEERGQAIAVWAIVGGLGIAVGPVVGGLLLSEFSWGSVFLINVPIVIVAVVLGLAVLPESVKPGEVHLDPIGAVLSVVGLATLMFGIIEGPVQGWGSPLIVGSIVVGLAVCWGFVVWELRRRQPMFDPRILRRPPIAVGALVLFTGYGTLMAMLFLVPNYLQSVQGLSVIATGFVLLAFAGTFAIVSNLMSRLTKRFGSTALINAGLGGSAVAAVGFAIAPSIGGTALIIVSLCIAGPSVAVLVTPATTLIINGLPDERAGEGSTLSMLSRFIGATVGVAVVGSVFSMIFAERISQTARAVGVALSGPTRNSFHAAIADADQIGGDVGRQLADAARGAFDVAFAGAFAVVGVVCLATLTAMVVIERRTRDGATPEHV